jgi:hypothetical protein
MKGGPAVAESHSKAGADPQGGADEQELLRALVSGPAVGVPQHADEQTRKTFQDRRMGQREAYGQFVADGDIYWPGTGTLVFTQGMAVPMEHVEKWLLEEAGLVHRVASPRLAAAGRRFPANEGGQVTGGDGDGSNELMVNPPTTPPAPSGEQAAADDEAGTTEKQAARKSTAAAKK